MRREVLGFFCILCPMWLFAGNTELCFYRPLTVTSKHPMMSIAEKKEGQCTAQSQRIRREDAWACMAADGVVYDPCFVSRFGSHLEAVCLQTPWSLQGVQIIVATPLDDSQHELLDMSRTLPWAVELANGDKCEAIQTSEEYDGLPVHYRCEQGATLIGHVQRCTHPWKILQHGVTGVVTTEIAKAWF